MILRKLYIALFLGFLSIPNVFAFDGFLEPNSTIDIVSPETGVVSVRNVEEGDIVKEGDVLVELDSDILQASLNISKAQKSSRAKTQATRAEYDVARKRFAELEALYAKQVITKEEFNRAKSQKIIARSNLKRAKDELKVHELEYKRIQKQLLRRKIISPINGVVTEIKRDVGELISMNQGSFIQVVDVSFLKMIIYVPFEQSMQLKVGESVSIEAEYVKGKHPATVKYISPIIDPASSTVKVELKVDNKDNQLKSGIQAKLLINDGGTIEESVALTPSKELVKPKTPLNK